MRCLSLWKNRVESRVVKTPGGCWIWQGATNGVGYGKVAFMEGGRVKYRYTHRIAYEALVGPLADGLELDHLCRNRTCCNPDHLEAVTSKENSLRGKHPNFVAHVQGVCRRGHPVCGDNARARSDGRLRCRICSRSYRKAKT